MLKIGHRGAPGYPRKGENTLASFEKALSLGVDAIELDVRRSKDNRLVVIHDATIDRTTNGRELVSNLTYAELKTFDAGLGRYIPLLDEVLDVFGQRCLINIELKESGLIDRVASTVLSKRTRVIISAFDTDDNDLCSNSSWEELGSWAKKIPVALLATCKKICGMGTNEFIKAAKNIGAVAVNPEKLAVFSMPRLVNQAHANNLLLYVWTVNSPFGVRWLKFLGVDGIFSDRPEIL